MIRKRRSPCGSPCPTLASRAGAPRQPFPRARVAPPPPRATSRSRPRCRCPHHHLLLRTLFLLLPRRRRCRRRLRTEDVPPTSSAALAQRRPCHRAWDAIAEGAATTPGEGEGEEVEGEPKPEPEPKQETEQPRRRMLLPLLARSIRRGGWLRDEATGAAASTTRSSLCGSGAFRRARSKSETSCGSSELIN